MFHTIVRDQTRMTPQWIDFCHHNRPFATQISSVSSVSRYHRGICRRHWTCNVRCPCFSPCGREHVQAICMYCEPTSKNAKMCFYCSFCWRHRFLQEHSQDLWCHLQSIQIRILRQAPWFLHRARVPGDVVESSLRQV